MIKKTSNTVFTKAIACLIFVILLATTVFAWYSVKESVALKKQQRFNSAVANARERVQRRLATYEQILWGGVALFDSSDFVSREEWRTFTETLQVTVKYPGIQGIGFSRMLMPEEKTAFETAVQSEGFPDFHIHPEGERDRYSSIVYLEPFDFRNQRAFGYDMFSESVRREAMTYAAENGVAAISGRVTLLQETDTDVQAGFLMYLPVYQPDMALDTPENRLRAVMGFVYSPFRMNDLMNGILGEGIADVEFEIYDTETPSAENLLYHSYQGRSFLSSKAKYQASHVIQMANRSWLLSVASTPAMESEVDNKLPVFVLSGGLVIDLLIFIVLWTTASGRQRLEKHALELQQRESQLQQAKEQLEVALQETSEANETNRQLYLKTLEIDELKTQFFANVSHELRTPLTLIIGPIQKRLKQPELSSDDRHDLEMILRNARFLHRHVSNLLDIAKLDTHRMKVVYSETNLVHLIRTIASNFEVLAGERQIHYRINLPDNLSAQIDVEKFQRILLNLLSNAFKFTLTQGEVRLALQHDTDNLVLTVADSGPGIPKDQRNAVFDRFHQVENQDARIYGGTGLGLAIVKEFVLLMGGQIEIADTPEQGACFVVRLPLKAPAGTELVVLQEFSESGDESYYLDEKSYARRQSIPTLPEREEGNLRRILIVEDNQDMQEYLRSILAPYYRLLMASNGQEGLQQVAQMRPDLILTDIMMPQMSGDQMIAELRQQDEFKNLPILVLSARSDEALRTRLFKNGVQDYIDKPFSEGDLLARIKRILSDYQHFTDEIELNEERYRFAFEASETGVWDWKVQSGQVEYSERWKEILGYHGDEIRPDYLEWESRLHPEDKERVMAELQAYFKGDSPSYTTEYRMQCKDGHWKWVASRGRIVSRDGQGQPLRIVGTQVDVDQQKQAETFLLQAKESAEKAMQAKSNFLANMSHEIRTPMSAIMGFTELMMDTPLSGTQKDYLQKTRNASEDLLNIINDILDISKIDSGLLVLESHPFDPKEVLNNVVQLFSPQIKAKKLKQYLNIDLDIPPLVIGDDLRIRQVLKNLLSNAVKFTAEGEIRVSLSMTKPVNQETLLLCFRVEDTGIGINNDQIDYLFQPFTQADTSITRQYGGTGLGLSICNQLVNLMGGRIEVNSELGRGSQFSFTVQVKEVNDQSNHDLNHFKQAHCLIVSGHETPREQLTDILHANVQRIDVAATAQAGIEQVTQKAEKGQPFDLVFLDWQSDSNDSMTVMQTIEQNARKWMLKRTPVIVMVSETERHQLENQINHYNIQPDAILNKPIESNDLLDVLQEISLRQLSQSARQANQNKLDQQAIESIQGARVLLVEDNLLNQQVVSEFLQKNALKVTLANHGGEALQYMNQGEFDIILMDLQMPVMDGLEACQEIRKLPQGRHIPVIAMTAAVMQSDRAAAARAGMNDFSTKPINPKKLLNTLVYWLNQSDEEPPALEIAEKSEPQSNSPDGFDFSEIMEMLGGDQQKLLGLLKMFVEDFHDSVNQVDALLKQNQLTNASKAVHKLTGISSNLGAVELGQYCHQIEVELQNGEVHIPHLRVWRKSFHKTLATIKTLLSDGEIKLNKGQPDVQDDSAIELEYERFFASVQNLNEHLQNHQWIDLDELEHLVNIAPVECHALMLEVAHLIRSHENSQAQMKIQEILKMAEVGPS